jgi:SOS-response transcriptional repressor LexA
MLHTNQAKILELAKKISLSELTLQEIALQSGIGKASNQLISFHVEKLKKKGYLNADGLAVQQNSSLISIPFYGAANAGPATFFADDKVQGYIKVSKSLLKGGDANDVFSIKVSGNSMNLELIGSSPIENGDYLIVKKNHHPEDKDVVVTIVEGLVNVKKYRRIDDNTVCLISNSTEEYPPIYLTPEDNPYVMGKVVKVLKPASVH